MQRHAHGSSKELSDSSLHRLNVYALAAGAAGVGILALAPSAEAEIVYTPAHIEILRNGRIFLDVNHDGTKDFEIAERSGCTTGGAPRRQVGANGEQFGGFCTSEVYVYVPFYQIPGNFAVGQRLFPFHAYALKSGTEINGAQPWGGEALNFRSRASNTLGICTGSWVNVRNRYLGLRFVVDGQTHFGWARLNVNCQPKGNVVALLTGYAYETLPNTPILAGQTQSGVDTPGGDSKEGRPEASDAFMTDPESVQPPYLGLLALGAPALPVWRRKETMVG
jgi:hypothetical protein